MSLQTNFIIPFLFKAFQSSVIILFSIAFLRRFLRLSFESDKNLSKQRSITCLLSKIPLHNPGLAWLIALLSVHSICFGSQIDNTPICSSCIYPHQSGKRASFWISNPARARNRKPRPGPNSTLIFEPRFTLESQTYVVSQDMRHCWYWWRSRGSVTKKFTINHFFWGCNQLDCSNNNWWQKCPFLQKEIYTGSKSARNFLTKLSRIPDRNLKSPARHTTLIRILRYSWR